MMSTHKTAPINQSLCGVGRVFFFIIVLGIFIVCLVHRLHTPKAERCAVFLAANIFFQSHAHNIYV